jgi:hypothetical protein
MSSVDVDFIKPGIPDTTTTQVIKFRLGKSQGRPYYMSSCVRNSFLEMANFAPVSSYAKFSSSIIILSLLFIIFQRRFMDPYDKELIIIYSFFLLVQLGSFLTYLLYATKKINRFHTIVTQSILVITIIAGALLVILFSSPALQVLNCCAYDQIGNLKGITSDIIFSCDSTQCNFSVLSIFIPLLVYMIVTVTSALQVQNIRQYVYKKEEEHDEYLAFIRERDVNHPGENMELVRVYDADAVAVEVP